MDLGAFMGGRNFHVCPSRQGHYRGHLQPGWYLAGCERQSELSMKAESLFSTAAHTNERPSALTIQYIKHGSWMECWTNLKQAAVDCPLKHPPKESAGSEGAFKAASLLGYTAYAVP